MSTEPSHCDLSPDLTHAICEGTIGDTVIDVKTGDSFPISNISGYNANWPKWWDARPDKVLLYVRREGEYLSGFDTREKLPAMINVDGTGFIVVKAEPTNSGPFAASNDGKWIAFEQDGNPWLYQFGGNAFPMELGSFGIDPSRDIQFFSPTWSPDSKKISWDICGGTESGDHSCGVAILDLARGSSVLISPVDIAGPDGPAVGHYWNPDNSHLVLNNWYKGFCKLVNIQGETLLTRDGITDVSWSPDGKWLALGSEDHITLLDLSSGPNYVERNLKGVFSISWSPDSQYFVYYDHSQYMPKPYVMIKMGEWLPRTLDLPEGAQPIRWIPLSQLPQE